MKTVRGRGMRDIPTIQGLRSRNSPANREQAVGEMARLEHEKARSERELALWLRYQARTESRLRKIQDRLDRLRQSLLLPEDGTSSKPAGGRNVSSTKADIRQEEAKRYREISIEY